MISVTEHIERLKKLNENLVGGDLIDLALVPAAAELLIAIKNRVANQGKRTDGSDLRKYSTDPIYAPKSVFIKGGFNAQGKQNVFGNTIGDRLIPSQRLKQNSLKANPRLSRKYTLVKPDYTERKTMYLKEGYKELRDVQGLRTDVKNMRYSGQLLHDYQLQKVAQGVLLGITTERSAEIYNGLTYGTRKMAAHGLFFAANQEEKDQFINKSQYLLNRLTVGILEGYDVAATLN